MDELELLKKDWQRKVDDLPRLTYNEIYRMIWKRSSSIVKWIFYISTIELGFWIVMTVLPFFWESYQDRFEQTYGNGDSIFIPITTIFSFGVILIFIFYLFKAYRAISVVDSVKMLMENILRTRKIVHYYVIFNLVMAGMITIYSLYTLFSYDTRTISLLESIRDDGSELRFWCMAGLMVLVGIIFVIGFIWIFYRLVYGILLKRLYKNYRELQNLEM